MNNKKTLKRVIIFIIIFIILFLFVNKLYNPVGTTGEWKPSFTIIDYYKQSKDTVDVLFIGSSNVYADVSPLEIYGRTGTTAYSFATPEQKVWTSYYMIKEALKTQKPKVIFLETGEFFSDQNDQKEASQRKAIDTLKFSQNKIDMMNDKVYNFSFFDKLSCIFPVLRFHSRWSNLGWTDITKFYNTDEYSYKGYILDKSVKSYTDKREEEDTTNLLQMPDTVKNYLEKIIELCEENECELVLMSMPTPKAWSQEKHDDIETYALQNDLNFIDLNTDDNIYINWEEDSSDGGLHLNIYGAERVGEYLATYIDENYELPDHRNDDSISTNWDSLLEKYNDNKETLKNQ